METDEKFKWSKFFSGLVNPLNFGKAFVFLIQTSLIVIVLASVAFSILAIKNKLIKPKKERPEIVVSGNSGGSVHNSQDEIKKKVGVLNLF